MGQWLTYAVNDRVGIRQGRSAAISCVPDLVDPQVASVTQFSASFNAVRRKHFAFVGIVDGSTIGASKRPGAYRQVI